jgi:fructose-bisphosphate aldolase class I
MSIEELQATIKKIAIRGRGILAADESTPTCKKRFDSIGVESTEENRQAYRDMLFTTPDFEKYVAGVILFDETIRQNALDGTPFPKLLEGKGVVPGIKVDLGVKPLPFSPDESYTQGMDNLPERLQEYKELGARFAKWRAVIHISDDYPTCASMTANAEGLANYAAVCQANGIVPIVEPELLINGNHTIERCSEATERMLHCVFDRLFHHNVILEGMILKPSMVISGADCPQQASVEEVAEGTLQVLRRTVPAAVPTINFLSGGQSDTVATAHLEAMNKSSIQKPWNLSFSYGRALQAPALSAWGGKKENVAEAQKKFIERCKANSEASIPA